MKNRIMSLVVLAAALAPAAAIAADATPTVSPYRNACIDGVRKLGLGEQVIGATQAQIGAAEAARREAEAQMNAGKYFPCAQAVDKGLAALRAG